MSAKSIYLTVSIPRRSSQKKKMKRRKWRPLSSESVLERIRSIHALEVDVYTSRQRRKCVLKTLKRHCASMGKDGLSFVKFPKMRAKSEITSTYV